MKKTISILKSISLAVAISIAAITSITVNAYASGDECTDPERHALNSWLVDVYLDDVADKEEIMATLKLMATGGFSTRDIFSYSGDPVVTIVLSLDPSYWLEDGETIKNETLSAIKAIPGNVVICNGLIFPTPALTGSNRK